MALADPVDPADQVGEDADPGVQADADVGRVVPDVVPAGPDGVPVVVVADRVDPVVAGARIRARTCMRT